ncbi:hypothetical protein [Archangium lansingense]|uniref:Uncharacterized protein n=1 Tax=Archangium lansingense TaxID=2995310 RepID=A0ABT3ZUU8_9BACT|nr:hypothetical protein [Archangium lansinium]MCY1073182.1 hypothetical protein [Archangium lansinium]
MASELPSQPPRFFVMEKLRGGHHDTEFGTDELNTGPAMLCPRCGDIVGLLTWLPPYRGELELYGKDYGDLMEAPCGGLLITERFAEAVKAEGLTGLSGFQPVEVTRVLRKRRGLKPGPPPRYLFAMPVYGNPALDMERSRILSKKPMECTWCRYVGPDAIDGLVLEEGTWNGEDVFRPRGMWGVIIVSERFMRFAERQAMSHMTLVPMEKYVWDPLGLYYPRLVQLDPSNKG